MGPERDSSFAWRIAAEFVGLGLLGTSLLATLALATYSPADPLLELRPVANAAGVVGAALSGGLVRAFGFGAVVVVGAVAWLGGLLVLGRGIPGLASRFWVGSGLLLIAAASLPPILFDLSRGQLGSAEAGWLGSILVDYQQLLFSRWGALLINVTVLALGTLSVTGISTGAALTSLGRAAGWLGSVCWRGARVLGAGTLVFFEAVDGVARRRFGEMQQAFAALQVWRERRARRARAAAPSAGLPAPPAPEAPIEEQKAPGVRRTGAAEPFIVDHEPESTQPAQETFDFREALRGPFRLPDLSTFEQPPETGHGYDRDSLLMNSRILEKKLQDFGVAGRVVRVHPGPVITMYEYEPASGVKVNKIVNLSDDLAMAMRALSIRIIAPLPGKSVVGIEVPNPERELVCLRTLLESESFRTGASKLTLAMGKDIFGNCVSADLAKMPHLLVAGATGTGKSVFLNSILCSILCRATPDELKLLLIDPKLLELSIYEGIPHLIADVVTNPKRAAAALLGIVRKMEDRYQLMSALQVRNIDQFNERVKRQLDDGKQTFRLRPKPGETEGEERPLETLPYIVVVVDELADLMVQVARDVEESLQRLAQMARAAGIHLILATQRPSVDVLTGVIKANFPARVSFQVSSRVDSRTVLDQNGSEHLLGQGDMLFLPPGTSRLQRLHGSYVSEKEVAELVAFLRDQGAPDFDEGLLKAAEESERKEEERDEVDEYFDRAVAIVAETRNASISYIQRRLKVGYNRAARIIEQMELDGMVGPQEGTKPREVHLRPPDYE